MTPDPDLTHTPMYTASEVEARTGVPATTLRQWERRYGFPRPARNASGYRLYSPQDLLEIGRMQAHLLRGVGARRAAELTLGGLASAEPSGGAPIPGVDGLSAELTEALLDSDHGRATAVLHEAAAHWSQEDVMVDIISPALVDIGQRWAQGEISIAQEHQASSFVRRHLSARLEGDDPQGQARPLVVAACAPGEQHELGLMMITVALQRRGVRVAFVGANSPLGDLADYVQRQHADGLALALQGEWALAPTRQQRPHLDELKRPVFLGGALMNAAPELAGELRGIYAGPDASGAADIIVRELQRRRAGSVGRKGARK